MRQPRHRNSTRDREKAELRTLRDLVPELEAHVALLLQGMQPQTGSRSAWRCFSERQARALQTAERTNRALNAQVQSNADWIQRLWELLHEKRRAEAPTIVRTIELQQEEDKLVFSQLKQQAEAAVPQLQDVLKANGLSGYDFDSDVWSHVRTGNLQSTLLCVRRVPFAMHSTAAALWTTLSYPDKSFACEENSDHQVTPVARVLERLPNVCAMKFRGEFRERSGDVTPLNNYAVVHRTDNVFIWKSLCSVAGGEIECYDTMWAAVSRCPSGGLQSIVTLVCQSQVKTGSRMDDASKLLAALIPATDVCVGSILSSADDILFKESFKSANASHKSEESIDV